MSMILPFPFVPESRDGLFESMEFVAMPLKYAVRIGKQVIFHFFLADYASRLIHASQTVVKIP